jgi:hypothetical protein
MMLHVRAGPDVVPGIVQLCLDNRWQGLDCDSGEFIEQSAYPKEGLQAWVNIEIRWLARNNDIGARQSL